MTNEMIIMMNSIKAMEEGILGGSGIFGEVTTFDEEENEVVKTIELPKEIHTFKGWRNKGYTVKRGEKSLLQFPVWVKTKPKKKKADEEESENENGKIRKNSFYLKNSYWFSIDQCEPLSE